MWDQIAVSFWMFFIVSKVTVRLKGSDDFVIYTAETMDDENVVPTGQDEVSTVVVPANKGATIFFWIEPYQFLGLMDIEVHASSLMAADALRRTLLVKVKSQYQRPPSTANPRHWLNAGLLLVQRVDSGPTLTLTSRGSSLVVRIWRL